MPVYSLKKSFDSNLTIEIDEKTYKIPLARSMKVKEVRKLFKALKQDEFTQAEFMLEFFEKYIPAAILDELTQGDIENLFELWSKANAEAENISLGESPASLGS